MMRNAMVAALVLSPLMLHAEDRPATKTEPVRVSTGVVAPKLVKTVSIEEDTASAVKLATQREVVVAMVVDEKGKPADLKIVQSAGDPTFDRNVLSAVEQYRFQPGTVSGEKVAVPVNLHITIDK
jgi:TonB family protein